MKVLIAGGASGIGKATAEKLLGNGHEVAVFDIDADALDELPGDINTFQGDIYEEERVKEVIDEVDFDTVVNCAGYYELGSIEDMDAETVEKHFQTNVFGLLNLTRNALPQLREKEGTVVNVSSVMGRISIPFFGVYSATKHSVEAISDALRMEAKPFGVDVVIVEPGPINTGFNERARKKLEKYLPDSVYSDRYEQALAKGGMAGVSAEEAAKTVVKAVETENPKPRYTITWQAWLAPKARKVLPETIWDRLIQNF